MTQLLSPRELAQQLSLKEQTIYNRHSNGASLPHSLKIGNRLRFRQADVDTWIAAQIEGASPPSTSGAGNSISEKRRPGRPTKAEQIARRRGAKP